MKLGHPGRRLRLENVSMIKFLTKLSRLDKTGLYFRDELSRIFER